MLLFGCLATARIPVREGGNKTSPSGQIQSHGDLRHPWIRSGVTSKDGLVNRNPSYKGRPLSPPSNVKFSFFTDLNGAERQQCRDNRAYKQSLGGRTATLAQYVARTEQVRVLSKPETRDACD
eukprot:659169-Rhodomonas_salina.3